MSSEPSTSASDRPRSVIRASRLVIVVLVAVACVVATDGIFNRWDLARMLLHWNTLELRGTDGEDWMLDAPGDCRVQKIEDPRTIVVFDSLAAFDRPHREAGLYRLYFRISDSVSTTLAAISAGLAEVDSTGELRRTVAQGEQVYRNLLRLFGSDTTGAAPAAEQTMASPEKLSDTLALHRSPAGEVAFEDLGGVSEKDMGRLFGKVVGKSPTILIGIGVGVAASAGLDLLKGEAYVAVASEDVFRMEALEAGARAGRWEGKDIDIFWVFAPDQAERLPQAADTLTRTIPAHAVDTALIAPDSLQQ